MVLHGYNPSTPRGHGRTTPKVEHNWGNLEGPVSTSNFHKARGYNSLEGPRFNPQYWGRGLKKSTQVIYFILASFGNS